LTALNQVCDTLEDIGHLPHDPQPFLEQQHQLFVLGRARALVVRRDVVVVGQGLLVALDRDRILFALEPPATNFDIGMLIHFEHFNTLFKETF
jgi:hypothetical protein